VAVRVIWKWYTADASSASELRELRCLIWVIPATKCERALQSEDGQAGLARGKPTRSTKGAQVALGRNL
jgi:hypothetical protein